MTISTFALEPLTCHLLCKTVPFVAHVTTSTPCLPSSTVNALLSRLRRSKFWLFFFFYSYWFLFLFFYFFFLKIFELGLFGYLLIGVIGVMGSESNLLWCMWSCLVFASLGLELNVFAFTFFFFFFLGSDCCFVLIG